MIENMTIVVVWFFVISFSLNFRKKLISLLMLEGIMISCVFASFMSFQSCSSSFFCLLMISVFMVVDSVLGISILICSSRNTSESSILMNSF